jgi:hypothetical protein
MGHAGDGCHQQAQEQAELHAVHVQCARSAGSTVEAPAKSEPRDTRYEILAELQRSGVAGGAAEVDDVCRAVLDLLL